MNSYFVIEGILPILINQSTYSANVMTVLSFASIIDLVSSSDPNSNPLLFKLSYKAANSLLSIAPDLSLSKNWKYWDADATSS
jgi:hypothetical protein